MATLHNHFGNFKVDLDVAGTSNRFHTLDVSLEEIPDPIYPGETLQNRMFERYVQERFWNSNKQGSGHSS